MNGKSITSLFTCFMLTLTAYSQVGSVYTGLTVFGNKNTEDISQLMGGATLAAFVHFDNGLTASNRLTFAYASNEYAVWNLSIGKSWKYFELGLGTSLRDDSGIDLGMNFNSRFRYPIGNSVCVTALVSADYYPGSGFSTAHSLGFQWFIFDH